MKIHHLMTVIALTAIYVSIPPAYYHDVLWYVCFSTVVGLLIWVCLFIRGV